MFKVRQVLATPDSIKGCNIPKVNVLYGKLRALFGVDKHHKLFGFDLASIEARIQGHYVKRYPELGGNELAESLLAEKPNSIHCINARNLGIDRDQAKAVTYACLVNKCTLIKTPDGYKTYDEVSEGDVVLSFNTDTETVEEDTILHKFFYENAEVLEMCLPNGPSILATANHRWLGKDADGYWSYATTDSLQQLDKVLIGDEYYAPSDITLAPHPNEDVFCITTKNGNWYVKTNDIETITGNCLYGAQAPKLQSMLGLSPAEAEKMYKDYWDGLPSLKRLKEVIETYWQLSDKKHVLAVDGRILTARSKHSLLNVLLQSGGSLVMKYAVLRLSQMLEERNLLGNIFEDNEEEAKYKAYQCIVYHDEVQIAIPKDWYNPQVFQSEDEAKVFRAEHHLSTPIHEEDDGWHIDGPNIITQLTDQSILDTQKHLNLNVEIGIEHSSGDTWADTH